jgi:hypothetical protein
VCADRSARSGSPARSSATPGATPARRQCRPLRNR